jgi:hypothetical protein
MNITGTLAETAILIAGAPRSGTTWLAKIFDSHPDVLYRHEPDEVAPRGASMRATMALWIAQRDARTAGKRPFFPKSWQSAPARLLRTGIALGAAAAGRAGLPVWPIPDLGRVGQARAVVKTVQPRHDPAAFAQACPDGRVILILRHPGGQTASLIRGTREGRFGLAEAGTDMPFDEVSAIAFAARHGVTEDAFQRLPAAARYAWSWRDLNETAAEGLAGLPNARLVIYEDLCHAPLEQARALLAFCGLSWDRATEAFVTASTSHDGPAGYFAVLRDAIAAAERWRTTMAAEDQAAVRAVVRDSPLARHWPDLST